MGKGTKELLHKILANQKMIMDHLKIKAPTFAKISAIVPAAAKKQNTASPAVKKSPAKKVVRKK